MLSVNQFLVRWRTIPRMAEIDRNVQAELTEHLPDGTGDAHYG
jgi:hypothetical protein